MSQISSDMMQYDEGVFESAIDCEFCSRISGMRLLLAWNSVMDEGIMNTKFECSCCHRRKWDRIPMPEVLHEMDNA